jgi:hypothetical protein
MLFVCVLFKLFDDTVPEHPVQCVVKGIAVANANLENIDMVVFCELFQSERYSLLGGY